MGVKQIMQAFWEYSEGLDDNTCDISCRKLKSKNGYTFYRIETSGNSFDAAMCDDDPNIVFFRQSDCSTWKTTDNTIAVELNGIPYSVTIAPLPITPSELAVKAGVGLATVYRRAKTLGRLPTIDELRLKPAGRPRKYTNGKDSKNQ